MGDNHNQDKVVERLKRKLWGISNQHATGPGVTQQARHSWRYAVQFAWNTWLDLLPHPVATVFAGSVSTKHTYSLQVRWVLYSLSGLSGLPI